MFFKLTDLDVLNNIEVEEPLLNWSLKLGHPSGFGARVYMEKLDWAIG